MGNRYQVVKRYGHNAGLSCAFRQFRAEGTHCRYLHGYALAFELTFEGPLDQRNWVISFGELKEVKSLLEELYDHKTVIERADPELATFKMLEEKRIIQLRVADKVGCEAFAKEVLDKVSKFLEAKKATWAVQQSLRLVSVRVSEHEGNSVIVYAEAE